MLITKIIDFLRKGKSNDWPDPEAVMRWWLSKKEDSNEMD
jgi:hypothetical protein